MKSSHSAPFFSIFSMSRTVTAVVALGAAAGIAVVAAGSTKATETRDVQATPTQTQGTPYDVAATAKWRADREADLKKPDGWLSVAGLHFLEPGAHTIGTDPSSRIVLPPGSGPAKAGEVVVHKDTVRLELTPETEPGLNGTPLCKCGDGTVDLREADPATKRPADQVTIGRATVLLHRSGDRLALRVRDPEGPIRVNFAGLSWYDIDPAWRLEGRFIPFDQARPVEIENVLGDLEPAMTSPGEVALTIGGQEVRLLPLATVSGRLWFVFRDASAPHEAYRFRFLYADAPQDGRVLLDFNRAYNPPCAFNPYTTCPLPPEQNTLTTRVTAGERAYAGPPPAPLTTTTAKKVGQ